jgi:hypothetical protein
LPAHRRVPAVQKPPSSPPESAPLLDPELLPLELPPLDPLALPELEPVPLPGLSKMTGLVRSPQPTEQSHPVAAKRVR